MGVKLPRSIRFCRSIAKEFLIDATKTLAFVISASSLVAASLGTATAANIPMITITNITSIKVNAFFDFILFIFYIL
jgi:hypothetical protein